MLYRACVLPIATYGSRLWLYEGAAMKGPLDSLRKMQRRACLWITGAFKTSPMGAAETLAVTSTAALYTTETHIQRIQGSHKTMPFTDRPTLAHSAKAILSLGTPPSTLPTVNQGPADPPIATHLTN
jgi:hypothetical protein